MAKNKLTIIFSKSVKFVVNCIIFISYARNIHIQHERKDADAGAMSETARLTDSKNNTIPGGP